MNATHTYNKIWLTIYMPSSMLVNCFIHSEGLNLTVDFSIFSFKEHQLFTKFSFIYHISRHDKTTLRLV